MAHGHGVDLAEAVDQSGTPQASLDLDAPAAQRTFTGPNIEAFETGQPVGVVRPPAVQRASRVKNVGTLDAGKQLADNCDTTGWLVTT